MADSGTPSYTYTYDLGEQTGLTHTATFGTINDRTIGSLLPVDCNPTSGHTNIRDLYVTAPRTDGTTIQSGTVQPC